MKRVYSFAPVLLIFSTLPLFAGVPSHHGAKVMPIAPPEVDGAPRADAVMNSISPGIYAIGPGHSLGENLSDYATNRSACHNIINYGDGTLVIGRMMAATSDATDRGTYYSYSSDGGATWTPLSWVEGTRQGWGNIDQFPMAAGTEITVAHQGLDVCVDAAKGANVWSCSSTGVFWDLWPRIATTDPFNLHIAVADTNPPTVIWYTRSTDAGASFDIVDQEIFTLPGFQPTFDAYDIASYGSNVSIVNAPPGYFTSLDTDILLATSTDNGTTWSDQVIYDMKGPGQLPNGETQYMSDGTVSCIYDNDGNLHVVWCNFLAIGDASNNPVLYFQIDAPLIHWSAATGLTEINPTVHDTSIVKPTNNFGNLNTQPDIGVDANNNLYVIYQQNISEQDTAGTYLQHIYATASTDGGATWQEPKDITPGTGFDASFGSLANLVDDNLHLTYFSDPLGGNFLRMNHPLIPVAVMYHTWPSLNLLTGVRNIQGAVPDAYRLEQNYPNPFNPATRIRYNVVQQSGVVLNVYDVLGRQVRTLVNEVQTPGTYEVDFDAANLADGTYFYTIKAGDFTQTRKMVLLK